MKVISKYIWIAGGTLLLLSGCMDKTTHYHQQYSVKEQKWSKQDTLVFNVDNLEKGKTYHMEIEGRALKSYPYKQLQLQYIIEGQKPKDTRINMTFHADAYEEVETFYHPFNTEPLSFQASSKKVRIAITHTMKKDQLPGISEIGILIKE